VYEKWIRCTELNDMYEKSFINKLYIKIKREVFTTVFQTSSMNNHIFGQTLFTNHRHQLITIIINSYITLRLKSTAKQIEKPKLCIRKKFTKLITLKND
jgi:hypothetical protein